MKFAEVKRFDHPALEQDLLAWWEEAQIFERSVSQRDGAEAFTFYEGPPTANGRPGIHHVMARTVKDLFCRYKAMKGYRVTRKAGWDTHGLPVEIEVEKQLGLEGRHQVEEYGMREYNAACRASVVKYKDQWDDLTRRMGYWVDLDDPYITYQSKYIETVWWLLKQIYEKGLLYQGYKIQWYSPGSGTVLSSHEVSLGYKDVADPTAVARFPLADDPGTSFLAWTTTPWTLVSNTALAVGAKLDYVKVRVPKSAKTFAYDGGEEHLIVAEALLGVLATEPEECEIVERYKGADLVGLRYTPPFDFFASAEGAEEAWRVIAADFVTTGDGTGVVHLAPAFGADDYAVCQAEGMPLFNPVDPEGRFTDEAPLVAGVWFKDADKIVLDDLKQRGLLYKRETHNHNYPHDWRKGTPLMSYPVESWFIRTTEVKDRMVALNDTIGWQPPGVGSGRFGEWLSNNVDWALSRKRYWGTPLPIWQSDRDPEQIEVIGSIEELRAKCATGDNDLPERDEDLDLHRPFVDELTWPDGHGGTMRRVEDLIDVWFDSGAMPFAQWHYPFENKETFEQNFPADFIAEGVDQTRGWFYTMHAIATLVMDSVAYKNVVVNGLVLDEDGQKMSKSKGNAIDPFPAIEERGADPVRWYMMANAAPWESIKFSFSALEDSQRRFFGTLGNVYNFFATYANVDGFAYAEDRIPASGRAELDRWILSRLATTTEEADAAYAAYNPTKAARAVEKFVDDLSNWYLRRSRRRFWKSEDDSDKGAAYQTVYECLVAVAKLMAPIAPFYGDWLYRELASVTGREEAESVHLADFPVVREDERDEALEHRMHLARAVSSITLALRNQAQINTRQPLGRLLVVTNPSVGESDLRAVEPVFLDEVNVRAAEYVDQGSGVVTRSAKPNFKRLGKRLGRHMKAVNQQIRALEDSEIQAYLDSGALVLDLGGQTVVLEAGDIEITSEGVEGLLVGQEGGVTVALDPTLTDELLAEGMAREVVNRIQNLRKQADYDVTDRIEVALAATPAMASAVEAHAATIRNETLAVALLAVSLTAETGADSAANFDDEARPADLAETFEIGGETLSLALRRAE